MAWVRSASVGGYGYSVLLVERTPGRLSLRYGSPHVWTALGHGEWERGLREARQLAGMLLAGTGRPERGRALMSQLLPKYFTEVSRLKNPPQPREEARRVATWLAFLPVDARAEDCTPELMRQFAIARRQGAIVVPNERRPGEGNTLRPHPTDTTIGHDIAFLQFVLTWAFRKGFLLRNPLYQYERPATARPRRPVASYDRFLQVRPYCDVVDPSGRFGVFMDLVEALGWRRGALCRLRGNDIDRDTITPLTPRGRIRKARAHDKRRVEQWIPMSADVRAAVDRLPVLGEGPLFPAPRDPARPWRGEHARDLLERAERLAGLTPLEGGDFHPYRRAWATARKHLPVADVMAVGGWSDRETLERCYQQADARTILDVVETPVKIREAR